MDWARENTHLLPANRSMVVAFEQTAGRGTRQKQFVSSRGGIYLTMVLRPVLTEGWEQRLITSLARYTCRWLEECYALPSQIKAPNDLLVDGKKIMGSMVETVFMGNVMELCLFGCGFNVSQDFRLGDYDFQATSLAEHRPMVQKPATLLWEWIGAWDPEQEGLI